MRSAQVSSRARFTLMRRCAIACMTSGSGWTDRADASGHIETFARKIGVTRQVLVNDDLGASADLARRMEQAAAETEAKVMVELLEGGTGNGPTMSDGKALFDADHGNKAAAGAAISGDSFSEARLAYATDAEMASALADLDRRIAAASSPRITQFRISSSQGT